MLLSSSLSLMGCMTTKKEYTFIPIKALPKTAIAKGPDRHFAASTVMKDSSGQKIVNRTMKLYKVYEVGTTEDANGDLVGPHQLYRVVETETWASPLKKYVPPKEIQEDKPKHREASVTRKQEATPLPTATPIDQRNALAGPAPTPAPIVPASDPNSQYSAFTIGTPGEPLPDTQGLDAVK